MAGLLMPSLPYKRSAKHSIVGLAVATLLLNSSPLVLFPLIIAHLAMVLAVHMVWLLNLYGKPGPGEGVARPWRRGSVFRETTICFWAIC